MEYYYQLEIWKGNINGALRLAREREELSDWLVAMAPMAAFDTWIMTCQDYAVQLESEGLYHKAATYLLAAHKVYDAIELFKRHRLFKEAIALAKVRLSPFDPVLEDLYMLWAHQLTNDGNYEQAAKCHLAMRQVKDAALLLARRYNCQSSLKTAARISLVASEKQQGMIYAHKIMQQHLLKYEWMEAYQFLKEQKLFQVLLAVSGMHELVSKELNKSENPSFTKIDQSYFTNWNSLSESKIIIPDFILDSEDSDAVSPWKPWLTEGHTFPHRVLRVWYSHLSIAMDTENIEEMYKSLSVLHAGKQTQVQLSQLLLQVSVDLVLCLLSLLMSETPTAISHLLHGVSCLHQAGHFKVMETILRIFLPQGPKYMLKLQQEITAMRVVISMESRSDFDGASKVHTIKRYMSELKEEDSMSCGGIRCRELDCLRAYYYLAILYFLKEEFNIEKAQNVKMDKPIAEVAPNVRRNNNTNYTEGQTNSQSDQINTHSDTNLKAVPSNPPSAAVMDVASATVMDVASATVMDVARDEENQIETSTTYQIKRHELDKNSEECIGKSASLVVTGNFLERENSHTLVLSEEGPPINVYLAKNAESSMKEVNSSSKLENNSVKDLHEEKLSNEMTLDSKDGSSVDGIHTPDACVKRKPKDCQQTENEVQNAEDVSLPDQNDNQKEKTSLKEKLATKTPSVSSMNVSYTLTYAKLSHLSRGLVWDIQGKRYALMETLGYIHKAISQLLLAQKPLSTTQTETVQSPAEDHEYSSQISQEITSFRDSNESLPEHFHEHEHLSHLMTHLSCHGDKKRHNSDPVPPLLSGPEGPSTHDNSNQGHRIARSVSSDSHSLDFHVQHDDHVCGSHGNSDLSDSDPLDLCTSCEWLNKSRKVLWKDEPVNQLGVENTGKGNMMSIINPAKYINTPDEWYHMSADQKYSKPYVTMAILKEEQEYMMNELKRGPDAIQAPFPNPIDSVKLLLDICHSNDVLTAAEKKQFTENAVTWALKFTVSTQQKDALMELMHKMLTH